MYALKQGHVGVREVQRSLGFSNASLAQYRVDKLAEMGLLKEDAGSYQVVGEVKVDVLKDFTRLGRILVPRFVFYAMLFTVLTGYLALAATGTYASQPIFGLSALLPRPGICGVLVRGAQSVEVRSVGPS